MQQTSSKTIIMSANGTQEKQRLQLPIKEVMISVASALIIGYGAILWKINETTTKIQEQQIEDIKYREEDRAVKNQMQLDMRDVRERLIKLETNTQLKPPL